MRRVILREFVTLGGLAAGPNDRVCPVVLASGKPLFRHHVESFDLRLLNTRPFDRGAVLLAYAPAKS